VARNAEKTEKMMMLPDCPDEMNPKVRTGFLSKIA